MKQIAAKIFKEITKFLSETAKNPAEYTNKKTDFSRSRKLSFEVVVSCILSLLKKSLQSEINGFFLDKNTCTKSAFCQARKKLKLNFFEAIFDLIWQSYYKYSEVQRIKKYRLWACDSTVQLLPDNEETRLIGIHKNQHNSVASCKLSVYFDVFNKLIVKVLITDKRNSDLYACAENQIKMLPCDVIAVYDRAYTSQLLFFLHLYNQSFFVVRAKLTFNKAVILFLESDDNERIITERMEYRCSKKLAKMGIRKSGTDFITYRMVKVVLPTGDTEVLITNLLNNDFTINDLAEIYRLRWRIETCFNALKNHQMLGTFSGYSELVVKQDILSNVCFYNLLTITMLDAENKLKAINKKRTKNYKINRNIGAGILKDYLPQLLKKQSSKKIENVLERMTELFLLNLEKTKETNIPRKRKRLRCNDRHHTEKNYKRAF